MAGTIYGLPSDGSFPEQIGEALAGRFTRRHKAEPAVRISDVSSYVLGDQTVTTWETYDGSGVIVHPSVRYFPEAFNGYHWWAAMTPYTGTDNQVENPSIVVSDNGTDWVTPPGLVNPLFLPQEGGYNSDTHLTQGPDGKLYLFFRDISQVPAGTGAEKLRLMTSDDGIAWTEPAIILAHSITDKRLVSPAVWWDSAVEEWVLLAVSILPAPNVVERWTATDPFGPWVLDGPVDFSPAIPGAAGVWHLDAMDIGGQVVALVQDAAGDSGSGNLYYCTSDDGGRTFRRGGPLTNGGNYRSCFVPMITEDGLRLETWVGYGSPWGAGRASAYVPRMMEEWQKFALEMFAATRASAPFIAGDDFNRADSPASLGAATSGQAWAASAGVLGIAGGKATAAELGNHRWTLPVGQADVSVSATVDTTSSSSASHQGWVIARFQDSANFLRLGYAGQTLQLMKFVGNTGTTLFSVGSRPYAPHRLELRVKGNVVSIYEDGFHRGDFTDEALPTGTAVGIQANAPTIKFDDLSVKKV